MLMRTLALVVGLPVFAGCLLTNPAFGDDEGGSAAGSGGSTAGSAAATGGGATSGTTTGDGSTGAVESTGSTGCVACVCAPGATEACYSGPPGTEKVGTCEVGKSTCDASGAAWGPCEGEVTPVMDVCSDGLDQDCSGVADDDVACAVDPACPQIEGLRACYPFPAGVLDELRDGSGNKHHGPMTGVSLVPGLAGFGQTGVFGVTSLATVPEGEGLSPAKFTAVMFIRPVVAVGKTTLLDKDNQFGLFRDALGKVTCIVVNDKGATAAATVTAPDLVWSMLVCSYDGSQVTVKRYGGAVESKSAGLSGVLAPAGTGMHVGSDSPNGDNRYLGELDQVLLFDRVLKPDELCVLAGSLCK